jgi:hypothetical protein
MGVKADFGKKEAVIQGGITGLCRLLLYIVRITWLCMAYYLNVHLICIDNGTFRKYIVKIVMIANTDIVQCSHRLLLHGRVHSQNDSHSAALAAKS